MRQLTEKTVRDARPGDKVIWLGDGDGLWVRIRAHRSRREGSKTFLLRQQRAGKITVTTLGHWPAMTLAEARHKAQAQRRIEVNPSAMHLGDAVDVFLKEVIGRRYARPEQIRGYLQRDLAPIAQRSLATIQRAELAAIIRKKVEDGPVAANRLLEAVKRFFRWCVEIGWLHDSPAQALTRGIAGGTETARERILSDDEIRRLWTIPEPHGALLQFLLLTGARIGEAQLARWSDIEGEAWRIPAENAKNRRAHLVHLSAPAQKILATLPRRGDLVFRLTSDTAVQAYIRRWCEREKIEPRFTPHDLRRTFSTRMNTIGVLPHVVEKCLNHVLEGVMAVYNRADYLEERRAAFHALGREVERILSL